MSRITLYTNPLSRGRIARWMLEEVGADYETRILTYNGTMKEPAYLAINPMGKVPAIIHDGKAVTECAAICAYLADAFPDAGLAPEPSERGDYYRWMFFGAGPLEASVTNRSLGFIVPPEKERVAGYGNFDHVMDTLDAWLSEHPYIAGHRFTAADVYVGAQINWGMQFGTFDKRESFAAYAERLAARPAFIRATRLDDEAAAAA
ncbi:glutathione S-transferase family protein [Martelella lutilitoris]|uniref:Glutathione S-transferase family protein n=1 Tax=Martelella lutilitoris TaxID=2583532 RepID=A0A5C4JPZ1_9HYPH|nr:glutathione S-transferase family protein [Martelella lutilitoris]TNB47292.1 glutathione S-transferase family protein [Martelella lutilitoris]